MEKEPNTNGSIDETVDKFFESLDANAGEQHEESSPQTEQVETQTEGESDSQKTQSTDETAGFKGVDKGFANHPAWIERESKLKEATAKLKELEGQGSLYAKLLDDPQVYGKYLEAQGFSPEQIRVAMAEKGFETEKPKETPATDKAVQAQAIAEKACQKLGWDIKRLDKDQIAYLKDSVQLTMAIMEDAVGSMLDQRLRPLEESARQGQVAQKLTADEHTVMELAKEEFPDLDYKKDIEPAMQKYLDDLDRRDPKKTMAISFEDLYQRATRTLLKELQISKGRQEVRNTNKANARPLMPGASTPQGKDRPLKGRTVSETADKVLDAMGVR